MIRGVGIDIIEVQRVSEVLQKYGDRFLSRILTENEINYCKTFSKPELHFAGRFAVKEAYSKAIGTGIGKRFSWKDIEILNDKSGKPYVVHLKENEFSSLKFEVSIAHTDNYACAVVVCSEN